MTKKLTQGFNTTNPIAPFSAPNNTSDRRLDTNRKEELEADPIWSRTENMNRMDLLITSE